MQHETTTAQPHGRVVLFSLQSSGRIPEKRAYTPISGSGSGEMPTTGGVRPGPAGAVPNPLIVAGSVPVEIKIAKAQVDAQVERQKIVDGRMLDPSGPYVVSWYDTTAKLGEESNVVMAGHLDYYGVAQAVFYHVGDLKKGDAIAVTGGDREVYAYRVDWVKNYVVADLDQKAVQQIVGDTQTEKLTLITCGGGFDSVKGEYVERMVIRASRAS